MNEILAAIILPIIIGAICLLVPKRFKTVLSGLALLGSTIALGYAIGIFIGMPCVYAAKLFSWCNLSAFANFFRADSLAKFISLFVTIFGFLTVLYSIGFMNGSRKYHKLNQYYAFCLMTIGTSIGAVLSNNLILFVAFWGFLGLTLYLLIGLSEKARAPATAKKTFIIIGGSDAFILLGIAIIWQLTKSFQMSEIIIPLTNKINALAFICLAIGAFAKAGAMPLHTWIPDTAEDAPVPVVAFLPASLDKLLGIYFLARICLDVFVLNSGMSIFLMAVGSFTIVAAVMMALVQHDLRRLLGYHAVSQVGYMVLGIGTGTPVGIVGGLFHMLNNAIYKSCLFLSGGGVEKNTGTSDLDKLGGLSRAMPISFITFLIACLAISGVPPLNGFFSKWMVYQGVIEVGRAGSKLWIVWLVAAMFGSALTLASFMKLIHTVFLGQPSSKKEIREVPPTMWIPLVVLAALCVILGIFAYRIPLAIFLLPSIRESVDFLGAWGPGLASGLILIGILIGLIIYLLGNLGKTLRETGCFVGGEEISEHSHMRVSGVEFYETIKQIGLLKGIYKKAEEKFFDIYEQGKKITAVFTKVLQILHNGVLPTYLTWCLFGMIVLFYVIFKK